MKFLQLFPFYEEYVRDFYARNPGAETLPYAVQNARLQADGFGIVHMFARYLAPLGFETEIAFTECEPVQKQWLAEHGGSLARPDDWRHEIAARQVNAAKPDILYLTEPVAYDRRFLDRLTHRPRLVLAWKAAAILAFTRHGHMATYASWMRPRYSEVFALCDNPKTANELTLSWGVTPFVMEFDFIDPQNTIETGLKKLTEAGHLKPGETVVIIGAISVGTEIVDAVQMRVV